MKRIDVALRFSLKLEELVLIILIKEVVCMFDKFLIKAKVDKESLLKPIGAGLSMLFPLLLAGVFNDLKIGTLGVMGSFSYLAFQNKSLEYNLKAILFHGIALFFSFTLGIYANLMTWAIPFIISVLSFIAFLISKMFVIPKPDYFFVIMLFAMGTNMKVTDSVLSTSSYLLFGIMGSLLSGLIISLIKKLPIKRLETNEPKLSLKDRYYVTIYKLPNTILSATHFSMILFCSAYVSTLFSEQNGYWILISSAAILAGERIELIKKRSLQRVLGSIIGLLVGLILLSLNLPTEALFVLLIILNILVEYFIPKNYTIANFFTNPQVLILSFLASGQSSFMLAPYRFFSTIIGSGIALILMILVTYEIEISKRNY